MNETTEEKKTTREERQEFLNNVFNCTNNLKKIASKVKKLPEQGKLGFEMDIYIATAISNVKTMAYLIMKSEDGFYLAKKNNFRVRRRKLEAEFRTEKTTREVISLTEKNKIIIAKNQELRELTEKYEKAIELALGKSASDKVKYYMEKVL